MYLVCITKRVFIIVCLGKKVSFSYGILQFLRITNFNYSFLLGLKVVEIKPSLAWSIPFVPSVYHKKSFYRSLPRKKFSFSYGNLLLEIMSKIGGTPFGRQEFLVFSPPRSRALSPVSRSSLARLSPVSCSSLARLVRLSLVLFVSRSSCSSLARLVRLTLVRLPFGLSLSMFMM